MTELECPLEPILIRFLDAALPPDDEATVATHLEECPSCQHRLEVLSAASGPLAVGPAGDPTDQQSLDTFLQQVKALGAPDPVAPRVGVALSPPPDVPNYEILGEIGRGGMGVVYRAIHRPLNRVVALKMILSGAYSTDVDRARFRAEAEAIARLQHPNIVQVFEVGEYFEGGVQTPHTPGRPYLALEYVPGGTLQQRMADRPHRPRLAAGLICRLARAIDAAHAQKLIHRDLKPGNVLLAPALAPADDTEREYGIPKLTDFGLAKRLDAKADHPTLSAVVTGTPSYMAPEQVPDGVGPGPREALGPWTDVWALGIVLYQLLTGHPPFLGPDWMATLLQVVHRDPVPIRHLQPAVPRDLETICLKCLEKPPAHRYPTAAALADDLDRFLSNQPIQARPVGAVERGLKWARRHPVASAALATAAAGVLAAIGGLGFALHALEARRTAELATLDGLRERERLANQNRLREEGLRLESERSLYRSKVAQAYLLWINADLAAARRALEECPRPDRRWEWEYINQCCNDGLAIGTLPPGYRVDVVAAATSWFAAAGTAPQPPGRARSDPVVSVWGEDGQLRARATVPGGGVPVRLVATPDGRRLTLVTENPAPKPRGGLALCWDVPPATPGADTPWEPIARLPIGAAWAVAANGRVLLAGLPDSESGVLVHDLAANARVGVIPVRARSGTVSASGSHAAVQSGDRIHVWTVRPFGEVTAHDAPDAGKPALDPDGRRLVYHAPRGRAVVVRDLSRMADPPKLLPFAPTGTGQTEIVLAFGRDGRYLVAHDLDGVRVWEADGGWQTPLAGHPGSLLGVFPDPFGPLLATTGADATVRLWTFTGPRPAGPSLGLYRGHAGPVRAAAFAPDRRLVTGGEDGTARVWDLTRSQQALPIPGTPTGGIRGVWFSADGALFDLDRDRARWSDPAAGVPGATFPVPRPGPSGGHAYKAAFARVARRLAVVAPDRSKVHVHDAAGRRVLELGEHKFPISCVAISDDGRVVVTGSRGLAEGGPIPQPFGELVVWDGESGVVTSRTDGPDLCVCALTVTPDGATAAVATGWPGWDRPGEPAPPAVLRLIRTDGRQADTPVATDPHGVDPFVLLAMQPGGDVLAAVSHQRRDRLTAFRLPEGKPAWMALTPGTFAGLAFHADGERLATLTEPGGVTVYDVISGAEAIHLSGPGDGSDPLPLGPRVAFSPDGRSLAAGFRSGLMVWRGSPDPDADRAAWRAAAAKRARATTTSPVPD